MKEYDTNRIIHFLIAASLLKIVATSLKKKDVLSFCINAKHEECR